MAFLAAQVGYLSFTFWAPMLLIIPATTAFAYFKLPRGANRLARAILVTLGLLIGVAASEAAGFHHGHSANQWFVITGALTLISMVIYYMSGGRGGGADKPS